MAVSSAENRLVKELGLQTVNNLAAVTSENILSVRIRSPAQYPIHLIDLPGILGSGGVPNSLSEMFLSKGNIVPISMFSCDLPLESQHTDRLILNRKSSDNQISILTKPDLCRFDENNEEQVRYMWRLICTNQHPTLQSPNGWFVLFNPDRSIRGIDTMDQFFMAFPFWQKVIEYDRTHGRDECRERY